MAVSPDDHPSLKTTPNEHPAPTSRSSSTWRPETYKTSREAEDAFLSAFRGDPERDAGRPETAQRQPETADEPQEQPQQQRRRARQQAEPEPEHEASEDYEGEDEPRQEAESEHDTQDDSHDDLPLELDEASLAEFLNIPVQATDDGGLRVKVKVDGKEDSATLPELVESYQTKATLSRRWDALTARERDLGAKAGTIEQNTANAEQLLATVYHALKESNPFTQGLEQLRAEDLEQYNLRRADAQDWEQRLNGIFHQAEMQRQNLLNQAQTTRHERSSADMAQQSELVQRNISGWNADMKRSIEDYARNTYGMTDQQMAATFTHWGAVDALRKAQLYDQGQKTLKSKKVKKLPKVMKPTARQSKSTAAAHEVNAARDRLRKTGRPEDFLKWFRASGEQQRR